MVLSPRQWAGGSGIRLLQETDVFRPVCRSRSPTIDLADTALSALSGPKQHVPSSHLIGLIITSLSIPAKMKKDAPLQRCFYLLSLRQGTVLIGLVVLLLSGFCLFLLLLGSTHAHLIATMLEADIEYSAQREGIVLSDDSEPHSQNDVVLHKAHNLALLVIVWLYIAVTLATVHFVLCVLLLYGAVMRIRRLLVPWMCMALVGLILCCTAMLVSMYLVRGSKALIIFVTSSSAISLGFYMWLVVYSHYIETGDCKRCMPASTHVTLNNHPLNNVTSV